MVIIDTNIIIDHLRQTSSNLTIYQKILKKYKRKSLCISTITVQELYIGKSSTDKQETNIIYLLNNLKIYSLTTKIAKHAGLLMQKDHSLQFSDAAIAATAIHYGASLATLNTKDFKDIPNLDLLPL